jgi:hypothetical protein
MPNKRVYLNERRRANGECSVNTDCFCTLQNLNPIITGTDDELLVRAIISWTKVPK